MNMSQNIRIILLPLLFGLLGGAVGGALVVGGGAPLLRLPAGGAWPVDAALGTQVREIASAARAFDEDGRTVAAVGTVSPSVVSISIRKDVRAGGGSELDPFGDLFEEFGFRPGQRKSLPEEEGPGEKQEVGGGTGFIVSADGYIMTNRHVVEDEDAEYTVILADGTKLPATVVDRDLLEDVAVIRVDRQDLPAVTFGDPASLRIGQTVIAIGNALSEFRNTVTKGVVSGVNRRITAGGMLGGNETIEGAIQTDAAINFGNSGGPLIDLEGKVMGMNTAVSRPAEAIGFAIPADVLRKIVSSVKEHGRIVRPRLGVQYVLIDPALAAEKGLPTDRGALILRGGGGAEDVAVVPGSPADKAGLVEGDIILEVDGKAIDVDHSLGSFISRLAPGDAVTLKVLRAGETKEVQAVLDEWNAKQ